MPRGGSKPGEQRRLAGRAGRKKGVPNKVTLEREEKLSLGGVMPIDVMLQTMRALWADDQKREACAIAKDAAPYCHPRLTSVEGKLDISHHEAMLDALK